HRGHCRPCPPGARSRRRATPDSHDPTGRLHLARPRFVINRSPLIPSMRIAGVETGMTYRRDFLKTALGTSSVLLLTACGGASSSPPSASAPPPTVAAAAAPKPT